MKIAYVATSDGGGAGHAALRLHEGMLRRGLSSDFLVRERFSNAERLEVVKTRADVDEYLALARDASMRQYIHRNRKGPSNSHFTIHADGIDLSKHRIVRASDIVHLHWVSGFQTPKDVEALLRKKPVVWTLHDAEPLTGGCHYPSGCDGYTSGCLKCPQLANDPCGLTQNTLAEKVARWGRHPLTLVVPSNYMADHVRRSRVGSLENIDVVHIPHGVDLQTFRPRPKVAARALLGIPAHGLYIVAGSLSTKERRKGLHRLGDICAAIRRRLPESITFRLLVVGTPELDAEAFPGIEVVQLGAVSAENMPYIFAAGDLFLHTSYEDNSPLMLLEALACGTPAIAFSSGGATELIEENICGHVVELGAESAMVHAASIVLGNPDALHAMSVNARHRVEEHYSEALSVDRHLAVYEATLNRSRQSPLPRTSRDVDASSRISSCMSISIVTEMYAFQERVKELEGLVHSQSRDVRQKQEEVQAVHDIAVAREELVHKLHADHATYAQSSAAIIEHQRQEIELLRAIAAERLHVINALEEVASERKRLLQGLHDEHLVQIRSNEKVLEEQRDEITLAHKVAEERLRVINIIEEERLRQAQENAAIAEQQRREILLAHAVAEDRLQVIRRITDLADQRRLAIEELQAQWAQEARSGQETAEEQQREIALVHDAAAERLRVIEALHRELERMQRVIGDLTAMLEEQRSGSSADPRFELARLTTPASHD